MNKFFYHIERAHQLFDLDRYEASYKEAREALKYDAESEEAFFLMIISLIQLEKFEEAEQLGQNALSNHSDSDSIHYALGVLYNAQDEYIKGRDHLEAAIRLDPMNSDYFLHLAKSHLGFNQIERSRLLLERSLQLNPNNDSALRLKSLIEQDITSSAFAHQIADKALNLSPEDAYSHLVKALLYWDNKNFPKAEDFLKTAVQLDPSNQHHLALWMESRTRNIPNWKNYINLVAGKSRSLLRPTLILGGITFLPSVIISNGVPLGIFFWAFIFLLMIPPIIFWWIRPYFKLQFFNKNFTWAALEMSNPSLPIEALASLNIITSILYWLSGNGLCFGIAFLSTILGGGIAAMEREESSYPIFDSPLRKSIIMLTVVFLTSFVFYLLYLVDKN